MNEAPAARVLDVDEHALIHTATTEIINHQPMSLRAFARSCEAEDTSISADAGRVFDATKRQQMG